MLRGGGAVQKEGLRMVREQYVHKPDGSHIMELGVAYLFLRDFELAWEHFQTAALTYPRSGDAFYGMAGVAKWCMGDPNSAVSMWCDGLKAKYARASGLGIKMPLLLFFASAVRPEVCEMAYAKKLLAEKLTDRRIGTWPGPIARLLMGDISDRDFRASCKGLNALDGRNRLWSAKFYVGLMERSSGNALTFKETMHALTNISDSEWQDEDILVSRLWHEEFFLARYEASEVPIPQCC